MTPLQGKVTSGEYRLDGGYIARSKRPGGRRCWFVSDKNGSVVVAVATLDMARKWVLSQISRPMAMPRGPSITPYVLGKIKAMRARGFPDRAIAEAMQLPVSTVIEELRGTPRPNGPKPAATDPEPEPEPVKEVVKRRVFPKRIAEVVQEVAKRHGCDVDGMLSTLKTNTYAHARQEIYTVLHDDFGLSFNQIGVYFHRDHTSVMSGVKAHKFRMGTACETAQTGA